MPSHVPNNLLHEPTLHPRLTSFLQKFQIGAQLVGLIAVILHHGLSGFSESSVLELNVLVVLCMVLITSSIIVRYFFSRTRVSFLSQHRLHFSMSGLWLVGLFLTIFGFHHVLPGIGTEKSNWQAVIYWTELCLILRGLLRGLHVASKLARSENNSAVLLAGSFLFLIAIGTGLLMLPNARSHIEGDMLQEGAPFLTALFTSTSASCVTGLTVVPTGSYWSPFGQAIILLLFQIGGLGIMTWGALFAIASGRQIHIRESVTLGEMLESKGISDVKRLLVTVLLFTLTAELIGALLISGLWSDKPFLVQVAYSLFHSISAFCNAGFSLHDDGFLNQGNQWQVWGPLTGLIICGGIGFAVIYNLFLVLKAKFWNIKRTPLFSISQNKTRLTLSSRLTLQGTVVLLLGGTLSFFFLESLSPNLADPIEKRWADAWFQSVTMRTAGFNTIDLGELQDSSKLISIGLMFVGASPGSTGGGIKTICFMLIGLSLISICRGRAKIEYSGRTIPEETVKRALTIVAIGVMTVMLVTLLLSIFENRPSQFIDIMFEATSAFATVGVSTGLTPELSPPSQVVIIVTMFLGRIGPLTLLIALSRKQTAIDYSYPEEKVMLG